MSRSTLRREIESLFTLFAGIAGATLATACSRPAAHDPRTDPPLVRVAVIRGQKTTQSRAYTGTVGARVQSDLGFRVSGKVVERFVSAGQAVRRGQKLVRLDDADLRLALVAQQQAIVAAAARAKQATDDETRDRNLVAEGAEPASAYDRVRAGAEAARADLKATEARASLAQNATAYAWLVADADGVIVETLAEPGQIVGAGQAVVRLAQNGVREAVVQLPETLRPPLGSSAQASLYGRAGVAVPTRLRELGSAADPLTRTFQARYTLEGPLADAPLGATVKVAIPEDAHAMDLRAPIGALFDTGSGPGVWVLSGEPPRVGFRPVEVSRVGPDSVSVSAGLVAGDRVVTLGAHLLHEGEVVRVAAEASAKDGSTAP